MSIRQQILRNKTTAARPGQCPLCGDATRQPFDIDEMARPHDPAVYRRWLVARCCLACQWQNEEAQEIEFARLLEDSA